MYHFEWARLYPDTHFEECGFTFLIANVLHLVLPETATGSTAKALDPPSQDGGFDSRRRRLETEAARTPGFSWGSLGRLLV